MRRTLLLGGIVFLVLAAPASAATTNVTVGFGAFAPATVQIDPGDTVHWTFSGPDTNHSVTADAGQTEMFDSDPGNDVPNHMVGDPFDWTFRNPGSFTYYCKVHPFTMKGRVNVGPQPNPPAGGNQPPSGNSPNQNPQSGGADTTAPVVSRLRVSGGRTCRGVRHCHKRPTRVSFTLSEAAKVRVSLKRRGGRSPAAISMGGKAGANKLSLSTRRVPPGRYTVTLRATDDAGNPSKRASATFRVR